MKTTFVLALLGIGLLAVVGCVKTVNDRHTAAVPWGKDKFEGRYERSMDQVYGAAKTVVTEMGVLSRETTIHGGTNDVRAIEAKVNQRSVWVRVEAIDPQVTALTVQARTSGGGTDIALVHEIEKRIALQLTR